MNDIEIQLEYMLCVALWTWVHFRPHHHAVQLHHAKSACLTVHAITWGLPDLPFYIQLLLCL
jgi:hypothetical protein